MDSQEIIKLARYSAWGSIALKFAGALLVAVMAAAFALTLAIQVCRADEPTKEAPWTTEDKVKEVAAVALLYLDYRQTMEITTDEPHYSENNLILGKHPKANRVKAYFGIVTVGQGVLAAVLPDKYRSYALDGLLIVEIGAVARDYSIGLTGKF